MIEELLTYQEADAKLRKIEMELAGSEERKKAVAAKKYLEGVEENINALDSRSESLNNEYQKLLKEQEKLREQEQEFIKAAENANDENEANYILKKIDELLVVLKNVSANINTLAENIQAVIKEYAQIKVATKNAQASYAENGKKYNELKASMQGEREAVEKELEALKKKVDPDLMERYLKKRANKIYPIVYAVNEKVCGACNMELSMNELNRLKNGEIIDCDQCGRLLYQK
ncbi:MAG: C4-type zinc ribbon domain-containing protein [Clostridia bacterium]|nr:C4-type zinc ribbon domain-containing protein [Clostridia bacterium]